MTAKTITTPELKAMHSFRLLAKIFVTAATVPMALYSQEESTGHSADDLAKALANPVASLISVPIQENIDFGYANDGWRSTTNIQPVVPISLNDDWNIISRTIVPIIFQEDVRGEGTNNSGLGDVLQTVFFSPKEPTKGGLIWGAGPALLLPTGTDDLSGDSWVLGPSAVVLKQQGVWTFGALVNHVWEVSGDNNTSASFLQPFTSWGGLGNGQTIALNTEATYDWENEQWNIPVNLMYNKVSKIGDQLVSYQAGIRCYLDSPSGGPDWGLRCGITFLFPK